MANDLSQASSIDPAMYNFLVWFYQKFGKTKAKTLFSCEGHRPQEPAWIRFEIVDKEWFDKVCEHLPKYCKVKDDMLQIHYKSKVPDLFRKLEKLKTVFIGAY